MEISHSNIYKISIPFTLGHAWHVSYLFLWTMANTSRIQSPRIPWKSKKTGIFLLIMVVSVSALIWGFSVLDDLDSPLEFGHSLCTPSLPLPGTPVTRQWGRAHLFHQTQIWGLNLRSGLYLRPHPQTPLLVICLLLPSSSGPRTCCSTYFVTSLPLDCVLFRL